MNELLLALLLLIGISNLIFLLILKGKGNREEYRYEHFDKSLFRIDQNLREDLRQNREESARSLRENREELNAALIHFRKETTETLRIMSEQIKSENLQMRNSVINALKEFQEVFDKNVHSFNELQREKFSRLETRQAELVQATEAKLEKMRETVEEKLQKTLNERLGQSFQLVNKQLESVQKGLGEMQSLAQDVGGLKKVLMNVKTRGTLGEIRLGNILEQILTPDQYATNVRTKHGSVDQVEFAVKLPGKDAGIVHLPIDSKFPTEAYHQLQDAYEATDAELIESRARYLVASIKKCAKDIRDKYIDPPNTTDFGIMFLPVEGLYAEVVRRTDLIEQLQREYKIIVTGPTTLAAMLNSLQMGFKTLAIERRTSEVWKILGAVKTEFAKFAGLLQKAKSNIDTASNHLENVLGVRTKAIERKLREVEAMPVPGEKELMENDNSELNAIDKGS